MTNSLDGLALPVDVKSGPNCGVTAVAVLAGVSFKTAFDFIRNHKSKSGRWRGITNHADRAAARRHFGVRFTERNIKDRMQLRTWVAQCMDLNKTYMVRTTGHVQIVRNHWVVDQCGARHISDFRLAKKIVTHIVEVA
jgi:hypothetical protein